MGDPDFIDEQRNADILDAMADLAYEQEQAMRESNQSDWDGEDQPAMKDGLTQCNYCCPGIWYGWDEDWDEDGAQEYLSDIAVSLMMEDHD